MLELKVCLPYRLFTEIPGNNEEGVTECHYLQLLLK